MLQIVLKSRNYKIYHKYSFILVINRLDKINNWHPLPTYIGTL